MIFEVASSFVGVSEIKNALKGGNLTLVVSETLKKAPKESLKIITSTKKITSKTAKEIIEEIKLVSGRKSLSIIKQLTAKPTYLNERIIWSNPNKTTTLIGKWSELLKGQENGLQKVFSELSETDLNIYMKSGKFDNLGGFNILSIENWNTKVVKEGKLKGILEGTKAFDDYIWETYNKPWLESAMQRGDDIILWSNPNLKLNIEIYYKKENFLWSRDRIYQK